MKGPDVTGSEDLGWHGSWRFTRERVVGPELTLLFHELYETAFGPLRTRAMARQVLTAEEFGQQMADADVLKYVAWTPDGDPVGMATLTNELSTVPWISPEYFAARYPEQWARGAVWFFGFVLTHPDQRHSRFLDQLIQVGVDTLVAQEAICGYDMCAYNDDELGLTRQAAETLQRAAGTRPNQVDTQNYYAVDFGTRVPAPPPPPTSPGSVSTSSADRPGTL